MPVIELLQQDLREMLQADDPWLRRFANLRDSDTRRDEDAFIAESPRVLQRVLREPQRLLAALLTPSQYLSLGAALEPALPHAQIYVAPAEVLSAIAGFPVHRGALALVRRPAASTLSFEHVVAPLLKGERQGLTPTRPKRFVLLQSLNNVDNLGSLFRNARAFGIDAIVLSRDCCDPFYRKAVRVSLGHVLDQPFCRVDDLKATIQRFQAAACTVFAVESLPEKDSRGGTAPVSVIQPWLLDTTRNMALIFGEESAGLSPDILTLVDGCVEIPMHAGVPSLNVAAASAVLFYELNRPVKAIDAAPRPPAPVPVG
jgi:tRNA G18 (ribose-2'-O)-methylase SpoU